MFWQGSQTPKFLKNVQKKQHTKTMAYFQCAQPRTTCLKPKQLGQFDVRHNAHHVGMGQAAPKITQFEHPITSNHHHIQDKSIWRPCCHWKDPHRWPWHPKS